MHMYVVYSAVNIVNIFLKCFNYGGSRSREYKTAGGVLDSILSISSSNRKTLTRDIACPLLSRDRVGAFFLFLFPRQSAS